MFFPMDIDFHIAAPDETAANRIADDAASLGYRTEIVFDDEEQDFDDDTPCPRGRVNALRRWCQIMTT